MEQFGEEALELMRGGYDLHTHTTPSHVKRALDDFELLKEAASYQMAGVLIKSHYETTHARAAIANRHAGSSTKAFGAVVLNWPVGGLNPYAVENALREGAKMVWLPTMDAENCQKGDMGAFFKRKGISVLDEEGNLKESIYDIFELVRQYGVPLATGHIGKEEAIASCREGIRRGVRMILTHPEWPKTTVPLDAQKELAQRGVYIEKLWLNVAEHSVTAEYMAQTMKEVGSDHAFMSTDRGQFGFEHPVEGLRLFIIEMLRQGISYDDIKKMVQANPRLLMNDEK